MPGKGGKERGGFVVVVKEDMKIVDVKAEEAENRVRRRQMIRSGDPWRKQPKEDVGQNVVGKKQSFRE